ncbi:MAG: 2-oxo acid dehydrogenase subunit E2, partial [Spirochaetales bacterium]|nr:2-oxo acid dehydrogenase subunit E2 [Spirochaetales bacterium]
MLFEFKLPDIGEGVHEATVLEWKRAVGDAVEEGEVLAVVETDKVTAEIPSPRTGVIRGLGARAGQSVSVGEVLARIETAAESGDVEEGAATVVGIVESTSSTLLQPSREGVGSAEYPRVGQASPEAGESPPPASQRLKATPVARRIAAMEGIELSSLRGSGPSGRILKADILEEIDSRRDGTPQQLSTLRRTATRNLEASWRIPAAVIHEFTAIDELVQARRALNGETGGSDSPKLSYLPFFIKAAAMALKRYPLLNAWYDEQAQTVDPRDAANIGFALDSDQGLVVPV